MSDQSSDKPSKIKFDGTVNLGHVLTTAAFLFSGFGVYSAIDKRVLVLEENKKYQTAVDHAQDERNAAAARQITDLLVRVEKQVERLNERLEKKP